MEAFGRSVTCLFLFCFAFVVKVVAIYSTIWRLSLIIGIPVVAIFFVAMAACACIVVRRRKQQPLGTATRVETPDAEGGYEMNGKDVGDFKLGSGRPAEDQHGIVPGPL